MSNEMSLLIIAAISISCLHTLSGPDHYVPFIVLSRSRGWSFAKTIYWTILCGCGHVWSSVLLGLGGAAIGWSLSKNSWFNSVRGGLAGWSLLVFGLIYFTWGLWRASQNKSHKHFDLSDEGTLYVFEHDHNSIDPVKEKHKVTPWVMFIIFLLGPCEPMIPLLYFPGVKNSFSGIIILVTVYTCFTLFSMVGMVSAGFYGFTFINTTKIERYMHAIGGLTISICGIGMVFLSW